MNLTNITSYYINKIEDILLTYRVQFKYKIKLNSVRKTRKEKLKVGFLVSQNQLWNCQSLYDTMQVDERFYVEIIALPNWENKIEIFAATGLDNYKFFKERKMNVFCGFSSVTGRVKNLLKLDYDILFVDQPKTVSKLEQFNISLKKLTRKYFICYVPYGYKVADGGETHFNLQLHNLSWKIFAESSWHYQQFKKMGIAKGKNVVISGFPKLDEYNNNIRDFSCWKNGKSSRKKIIWAPHWTFNNPGWSYSTFDKNFKEFLLYAKQHQEIDWIVKPHQRLFTWAVETGLMTQEEENIYFQDWENLPNASVNNQGNYMEIFKTSDALITDCGSFLAEYLPSKKPILHLYNPQSHFNEIGKELIKTYYRCNDFQDVKNTIERVIINGDDYKLKERKKVMKYTTPNKEGAGEKIKNAILCEMWEK